MHSPSGLCYTQHTFLASGPGLPASSCAPWRYVRSCGVFLKPTVAFAWLFLCSLGQYMNQIQWATKLMQLPKVQLFQPAAGSSTENTLVRDAFLTCEHLLNTFQSAKGIIFKSIGRGVQSEAKLSRIETPSFAHCLLSLTSACSAGGCLYS